VSPAYRREVARAESGKDVSERRHSVCPWWIGWLLANPVRRLFQDPAALVAPYVREGMTVLEPGPGMGFFTVELARCVGPAGRVVAVELQPQMLAGLRRRAAKAGVLGRLDLRLASPKSLQVSDLVGTVDFALACAVVHELPDPAPFFREVSQALKPGGRLLLIEPRGHVGTDEFAAQVQSATAAGLDETERPELRRFLTVLFVKPKHQLAS
jgi:ubiquinone/menaquinone biosynthesis C-methylase UbiE